MFLIVGLGNPGQEYARTRHNAGWFVIDELARRHDITLTKRNADARVGSGMMEDQRVFLLKPQTFMNLSGRAVAAVARYQHIEAENILVIGDDLNLPLGKLRLRAGGSDGGHNGLKSVAQMLGTTQYPRLRFGVGEPPREERQERGTANYVLKPFAPDEWPRVESETARAADCVAVWAREGIQNAMTRFN